MKRKVIIKRSKPRGSSRQSDTLWNWRNTLMGSLVLVVFGVLLGSLWLWRVGWFQKQTNMFVDDVLALSQKAGFSVEDILVEGRNQTDKDQIVSVLQVEKGSPILAFNPYDALKRLSDISWVKSGIVERRLPDTIFVRLYEREPIAIWQLNKQFKLIDREGHALRDLEKDENPSLPVVVGEGANTHAADLIAQLLSYQSILSQLKAAVMVSNRRWDLHLNNNVVVKLPEENVAGALEQLHKAITEQQILERNVVTLDLRIEGRMIIETPETIEQPKPEKAPPKI